jgi:hypothetical protein
MADLPYRTIDLRELTFPILAFPQGGLWPVSSSEMLTIATKAAVRSGYFDDMWIVDSEARSFRVQGCTVVKEPFWSRPKTVFGRGVRIGALEMSYLGVVSVDEVRARAIAVVEAEEAESNLWSAGQDVPELNREDQERRGGCRCDSGLHRRAFFMRTFPPRENGPAGYPRPVVRLATPGLATAVVRS